MSVSGRSNASIWKFVLAPQCSLSMPVGAQVLSVREQGDSICLWALVDPSAPLEMRRFIVFGTGHPLPADEPLTYLGTAHLEQGKLVFHVFERALNQPGSEH